MWNGWPRLWQGQCETNDVIQLLPTSQIVTRERPHLLGADTGNSLVVDLSPLIHGGGGANIRYVGRARRLPPGIDHHNSELRARITVAYWVVSVRRVAGGGDTSGSLYTPPVAPPAA